MDSAATAFSSGVPSGDLDFVSALRAAEAIRKKEVSSVELTRHVFERIERYNPVLNAFVYQLKEDALVRAKAADEAVARQESLGVFHGVPIHVKESFAVMGHPCTWGIPAFKDSKAPRNAVAVDRLLRAGAILVGATNVPVNLQDWQSYNPIYGTTNNPWDLKRTPGGSSGGAAAALAAGIGYLAMGSDIGGSIRMPSNFCGIYGHKPTLDLVNLRGHMAGGVFSGLGFSTLLAVVGPMARSASDLLAALRVLGGPEGWDTKAWKWELPPSRGASLKEFRVGYVLDDPIAPPVPEVATALEKVVDPLASGARRFPLTCGVRSSVSPRSQRAPKRA
jgi:amidase